MSAVAAFHLEAVSAQPGQTAAIKAEEWLWTETVAGRVLGNLRESCLRHPDPSVQVFADKHLMPRAIRHLVQ